MRLQDPDIVWPIDGIFAYSGGAADPVDAINAAPVHAVDNSAAIANGVNGMERNAPGQPPRQSPHNLYGHGPRSSRSAATRSRRPPLFAYTRPGVPPPPDADLGAPVISARIGFLAGYDPVVHLGRARRARGSARTRARRMSSSAASRSRPTNVVVQFTQYDGVSNGQTVGEGDVWVFSDGRLRTGRWIRPDREQPARYVDAQGLPILLHPGRTWVELLPGGIRRRRPVPARRPRTTTTAPRRPRSGPVGWC